MERQVSQMSQIFMFIINRLITSQLITLVEGEEEFQLKAAGKTTRAKTSSIGIVHLTPSKQDFRFMPSCWMEHFSVHCLSLSKWYSE